MKSLEQRLDEFVNYHVNGDGECNNVVLKEWAKDLSDQEKYELAFYFAVTYCVQSAIILFEDKREHGHLDRTLKSAIIFQSDRKYMKMRDNFERCLDDFEKHHADVQEFLKATKRDTETAVKHISTWVMFGRFAAFLFLETLCYITGWEFVNGSIEWKKGDTATSGLLNIFCLDKTADNFDRTGRLPFSEETMDTMLDAVMAAVARAGGSTNIVEIETSLCAYRKWYKGSRYNGYYLDRMLEELRQIPPAYKRVAQDVYDIRNAKFPHKYLGEIGGWRGIRKEYKRAYRDAGVIT